MKNSTSPPKVLELLNEAHQTRTLDLSERQLSTFPPEIVKLTNLRVLNLSGNDLSELPESIGELKQLEELVLSRNKLESLPESIGRLVNLNILRLERNRLPEIPATITNLEKLVVLNVGANRLTRLAGRPGQLPSLTDFRSVQNELTSLPLFLKGNTELNVLWVDDNKITELPDWVSTLPLVSLSLARNPFSKLPESLRFLKGVDLIDMAGIGLTEFPEWLTELSTLEVLYLENNRITAIPASIERMSQLRTLWLQNNALRDLPTSLRNLTKLKDLMVEGNPLNPALHSVATQGLGELSAYLRSLAEAEPLYEAKLVIVGEGKVGKTTLLKALTGKDPRIDEKTTHGVSIDVKAMNLAHPVEDDVTIQFNAWDFGGQEVYRVTHQFFFSRRSIYLLVWEPRMGVQQSQVEDWLRLIRLRVGSDARVIIVSTHAKTGERIARIDRSVFVRDFGSMICGFLEVDSLVDDPETGEKYGIVGLRDLIADTAKDLEQMGMLFNVQWREARDELLSLGKKQPRATYEEFARVCQSHGLTELDTKTLSGLMHDLGYIVYYGDDERLKNDVVLQPEWLTKAIAFVLEDELTENREGVLPDTHLVDVWQNHTYKGEPRYEPHLYPFFLRLMEKYDVSYRLEDGTASLVAQHVPQVRPALPWLPEEDPNAERRRLAMVYVMDEAPPGLVPWMIVRTHDFAFEQHGHRLHWQKGMFLRNRRHGEAMLELRGREFHLYTEAVWPEYFMNLLRQILDKLVSDNWPGMKDRYAFTVPCRNRTNGEMCSGRFDINALRAFLADGDETIRCQSCRTKQPIVELLFGFQDEEPREQLARIESKLEAGFEKVQKEVAGLESRLANYVMAIMRAMANEAKEGPRLFDMQPVSRNWRRIFEAKYRLRLWCEAENSQHPVLEKDRGVYEIKTSREWVRQIAPYANFIAGVMKTLVPMVAPSVDVLFGPKTIENLNLTAHLDLMKELTGKLDDQLVIKDPDRLQQGVLNENERAGLLALHSLLRQVDPLHLTLGLQRVPTYTGDFLWLCPTHYNLSQPRIPDVIHKN